MVSKVSRRICYIFALKLSMKVIFSYFCNSEIAIVRLNLLLLAVICHLVSRGVKWTNGIGITEILSFH